MTKHSKNNTASSIFSYAEYKKLDYGTKRQRLGNESMRRFDACALCLNRAREPVACGDGHLFCKECVYTDLLAQKKDIQTQKRALEALQREAEAEKARARDAARERVLRDFERGQAVVALPSSTGTRAGDERGTKRKFSFDAAAVEDLAREAEEAALRAIEREQAEALKSKLPDFWLPSLTPTYTSTGPPTALSDVKLQTTCRGGNPPHPIALKHLVPVEFAYHAADAEPVCPSCKKRLSNSILLFVMKPSAAASPPQPEHIPRDLVIPSLTLPPALRKPTPYGQTLGDLRLLVLGRDAAAARGFVTQLLLEDNEEVVEVGAWEDAADGRVVRASTDWLEHRDAHGLESCEPTRNVEIEVVALAQRRPEDTVRALQARVHSPFCTLAAVLDPAHRPSPALAALVSSPYTPLYTALVLLSPTAPDEELVDALNPHVPVIVFPRAGAAHPGRSTASFRPATLAALRAGLFRSPETLAGLRGEATDRFLRWREVEHSADGVRAAAACHNSIRSGWDKAAWEAEWLAGLSHDVARRLREGAVAAAEGEGEGEGAARRCGRLRFHGAPWVCVGGRYDCDPLYFPAFVAAALSLLGPLRVRVRRAFVRVGARVCVCAAVLGGFCVGVGVGVFVRSGGVCA
ncbi:hypothetical protein C0993_006015 [Termitomyces sp. T159_Od127]|nr:hypothetical protein C0993_006015 [Termitomyces sp. T159_Od127]